MILEIIVFTFFWLIILWSVFFFYQKAIKIVMIKLFQKKKINEIKEIMKLNIKENEKLDKLNKYDTDVIKEALKNEVKNEPISEKTTGTNTTRTEPTTDAGENKPRDSPTPRQRNFQAKTSTFSRKTNE